MIQRPAPAMPATARLRGCPWTKASSTRAATIVATTPEASAPPVAAGESITPLSWGITVPTTAPPSAKAAVAPRSTATGSAPRAGGSQRAPRRSTPAASASQSSGWLGRRGEERGDEPRDENFADREQDEVAGGEAGEQALRPRERAPRADEDRPGQHRGRGRDPQREDATAAAVDEPVHVALPSSRGWPRIRRATASPSTASVSSMPSRIASGAGGRSRTVDASRPATVPSARTRST